MQTDLKKWQTIHEEAEGEEMRADCSFCGTQFSDTKLLYNGGSNTAAICDKCLVRSYHSLILHVIESRIDAEKWRKQRVAKKEYMRNKRAEEKG